MNYGRCRLILFGIICVSLMSACEWNEEPVNDEQNQTQEEEETTPGNDAEEDNGKNSKDNDSDDASEDPLIEEETPDGLEEDIFDPSSMYISMKKIQVAVLMLR